ncbi:reversion-inducing cysteine-rich protein with Kazal motifs [Ixodes scapularis]
MKEWPAIDFLFGTPPLIVTLEFWSCINDTLEDINRGDGWFGRPCCHKPKLKKCQLACLKAQSLQDLQPACRQSDEIDFQACLEKQDCFSWSVSTASGAVATSRSLVANFE